MSGEPQRQLRPAVRAAFAFKTAFSRHRQGLEVWGESVQRLCAREGTDNSQALTGVVKAQRKLGFRAGRSRLAGSGGCVQHSEQRGVESIVVQRQDIRHAGLGTDSHAFFGQGAQPAIHKGVDQVIAAGENRLCCLGLIQQVLQQMIGRAEIVIIQKLFEDKQMVPEIMKQHFRGLQLFVKDCAGFPAQGFLGIWRRGLFLQLRHPGQVLEAEKSDAEQKHQHER